MGGFAGFWAGLNPSGWLTVALTLTVMLVNGWTDAPNAIATAVATRALSMRAAVTLAAVCNFLGVWVMTRLSPRVALTVCRMVDFGGDAHTAQVALCAALVAIVLWATAAWRFGIPTSESHALLAGLSGAALALPGHAGGIDRAGWGLVLWGLVFSTLAAGGMGYLIARGIERAFRRCDRLSTRRFFRAAQIAGAGATAFMHGAQDGQKFMGVFLLGASLSRGAAVGGDAPLPTWLMLLCAVVMALGTSVGGKRILRSVGMGVVKLQPYQGVAADLSAAGCLLLCSLLGVPVSTTNVKTAAIAGIGAERRLSAVHWDTVGEMVAAWLLTFPACGALGYGVTRLVMAVG